MLLHLSFPLEREIAASNLPQFPQTPTDPQLDALYGTFVCQTLIRLFGLFSPLRRSVLISAAPFPRRFLDGTCTSPLYLSVTAPFLDEFALESDLNISK